jgi:hypothetical protein
MQYPNIVSGIIAEASKVKAATEESATEPIL